MGIQNIIKAKVNKVDEFYTLYEDIKKELDVYASHFKDKTIYLPCDDPERSNFTKYFLDNFEKFGIKKLISTCYNKNGKGKISINGGPIEALEGNGDFWTMNKFRDEADIIITNPPYSLFRMFINWIIEGEKKFIIMCNINAFTYLNVFSLLKEGKIWLGHSITGGGTTFKVPCEYNDKGIIKLSNICWMTNLDHGIKKDFIPLVDVPISNYKHYDNYDAIEIPKTKLIPSNYKGVMGVPVTFLYRYNPEQFEIVGISRRKDTLNTKRYTLFDYPNFNDLNAGCTIKENDKPKVLYKRIFIINK